MSGLIAPPLANALNPVGNVNPGKTPLILDTFTFDILEFEVPEAFGDMAGTQSIEQHDFPGGTRTQKAYGYFPGVLKWRAKFLGISASDRAEQVKRILTAGREVKLQYGTRAWLGRLAKFTPTARHQWLYEYDAEFWPRLDYGSPGPTQPSPAALITLLSLHILSLQGLITYGLSGNLAAEVMAAEIGGPIGSLIFIVQGSVAAAGGIVGNVNPVNQQAIYAAAQSVQTSLQPYQASSDPTLSSPATDAAVRVQAIQNIMSASQPPVAVIQTINPNLYLLSAQYYNDPTQWRTIATANGLTDPQPIGSYTITVPQS